MCVSFLNKSKHLILFLQILINSVQICSLKIDIFI